MTTSTRLRSDRAFALSQANQLSPIEGERERWRAYLLNRIRKCCHSQVIPGWQCLDCGLHIRLIDDDGPAFLLNSPLIVLRKDAITTVREHFLNAPAPVVRLYPYHADALRDPSRFTDSALRHMFARKPWSLEQLRHAECSSQTTTNEQPFTSIEDWGQRKGRGARRMHKIR